MQSFQAIWRLRGIMTAVLLTSAVLLDAGCRPSSAPATPSDGQSEEVPQPAAPSGSELYARHCANCHGKTGDGNGIAAQYLHPKPRDLRSGQFRMVSTTNGVPTPQDIEAVLVRGMPGSSMQTWSRLSPHERNLLVQEVLRLRREGVREQLVAQLEQDGGDDSELGKWVDLLTTPGPVVEVPRIGQPDGKAVGRGKIIYFQQGCQTCHGKHGRGDGDKLNLLDEKGRAIRSRDLVREFFKGGHESLSLYLRIALGMPGTPMPAVKNLTSDQIVDLVQFCRSLSREPKLVLTNYQRAMLAVSRHYVEDIDKLTTR